MVPSFGAFLLVLAVLGSFLWGLGKYRTRFMPGLRPAITQLQIDSELVLGLRQRLIVVKVEQRLMVLSVTPETIGLIAQWQPCPLAGENPDAV